MAQETMICWYSGDDSFNGKGTQMIHPQTADTCQNPISKSCVSHCHWLNLKLRHMPETQYRGIIHKGVRNKPNNDEPSQVLTLSWKDLGVLTISHTPISQIRVGQWQRHTYGCSKPKTQQSCQNLGQNVNVEFFTVAPQSKVIFKMAVIKMLEIKRLTTFCQTIRCSKFQYT